MRASDTSLLATPFESEYGDPPVDSPSSGSTSPSWRPGRSARTTPRRTRRRSSSSADELVVDEADPEAVQDLLGHGAVIETRPATNYRAA
jgi:hypothetical protein